jgi:hypothetical protein
MDGRLSVFWAMQQNIFRNGMTHIKYERISKHDFAITIPKVTRPFGTPFEELTRITDELPDQVSVLASGGVDSEFMIKWLAKTKKVVAVCYKLIYDGKVINQHDIEWIDQLKDVCQIEYKTLDLQSFWESNWFWEYVERYKCTSPQLPIHAYMAWLGSAESFFILTAVHPEPKCFSGTTWVQEREKDYSVVAELHGRNCLVSPLRANSEMLASLLASDEFKNFHTFGIIDGRERKSLQYFEWFGIQTQIRPKYHGFEGSSEIDNQMRKRIFERFGYSECHLYIPYQTILENLQKEDAIYSTSDKKYIRIVDKTCHNIGPAQ